MTLERERDFWKCAGKFPANKEEVYPDHAAAHGLDEFPASRRVLEYGCGGGSDAMSWARRGHAVWYCDIVSENVASATERFATAGLSGMPWGLPNSEDLPFVDREHFDVVSSNGVLHHIEDPRPVLHAMRRTIKLSGRLIVMLYSPALRESFEQSVQNFMKMDPPLSEAEAFGWCTYGHGCPYARAYSTEQARELLSETGFRLLETRSSHKGMFLHHHAVPA